MFVVIFVVPERPVGVRLLDASGSEMEHYGVHVGIENMLTELPPERILAEHFAPAVSQLCGEAAYRKASQC